jgi:hypothetical protein
MRYMHAVLPSSFDDLARSLVPRRAALLQHRVYAALYDVAALRVFMASHVFAVWDFMSLLKTLQRRLTCVAVPWLPSEHPEAARLVNEIVLGEESDEVAPGEYASHFDIYREAMREIGADDQPIARLVDGLARGVSLGEALIRCGAPAAALAFVRSTFECAMRSTHEIAAAFLFGREELVPQMFARTLGVLPPNAAPRFAWYLERHVQLDGGEHAPKAARLLAALCGDAPDRWVEAHAAAVIALDARRALWDAVACAISPHDVTAELPLPGRVR